MAASLRKPTILFVHGAWHRPDAHYAKLTAALTAAGFDVVAPAMPSASGARPPTVTLDDDIAFIRAHAARLVDEGRAVLALTHSYGGIVTTSALTPELAWPARQTAAKPGGIVAITYLCAFLPETGGGVASLWDRDAATLRFDVSDDGLALPSNPTPAFYADVPAADALACGAALHHQPAATFLGGATGEAWRFLPITYVHCTHDGAIAMGQQERMVAAVRAAGALDVRVETLESSHSPWLGEKLSELPGLVKASWDAWAGKYGYLMLA